LPWVALNLDPTDFQLPSSWELAIEPGSCLYSVTLPGPTFQIFSLMLSYFQFYILHLNPWFWINYFNIMWDLDLGSFIYLLKDIHCLLKRLLVFCWIGFAYLSKISWVRLSNNIGSYYIYPSQIPFSMNWELGDCTESLHILETEPCTGSYFKQLSWELTLWISQSLWESSINMGRAGKVAQVVECLPSTHKALSSNSSTTKKK
jgi:hypothetical protein